VVISNKRFILFSISVIGLATTILLLNFSKIVYASFGTWGDTSLIHACYDQRGRVTIVDSQTGCNTGETQATWIKDVDAGTGLSSSRTSSGVVLSLASDPSSGWTQSGEAWTYATADSPSFTFTITGDKTGKYSPGMRVKLTQTTVKYFIVTKVEYSNPNTTITVYGGTDYTLTNATITDPYFSTHKAPYGFPLDPTKWTVEVLPSNGNQSSPSANTWYNVGSASINVPIGSWRLIYVTVLGFDHSTSELYDAYATLSTSNNSESDTTLTSGLANKGFLTTGLGYREKFINVNNSITYYLNVKTSATGLNYLYRNSTSIKAVCAYL
jgi:hypothetical protein